MNALCDLNFEWIENGDAKCSAEPRKFSLHQNINSKLMQFLFFLYQMSNSKCSLSFPSFPRFRFFLSVGISVKKHVRFFFYVKSGTLLLMFGSPLNHSLVVCV